MSDKLAPSERHKYIHNGELVYEWDQTFEEINIYVPVPSGVKARDLYVNIDVGHVKFGIGSNPPYLDVRDTRPGSVSFRGADVQCCSEDGVLHITFQKLQPGEPWASAIRGHELDAFTAQKDQQRLLLERFQQEHPGFDFSGAQVTGQVPNPRTFMGGLDSS